MASHQEDEFDALLEKSSLGGSAARSLRERTPLDRARTVRRITELRDELTDSGSAPQKVRGAVELLRLLEGMGYRTRGEVSDELRTAARRQVQARTRPPAADNVSLAEIEMCGELIIAASSATQRLSQTEIDEILEVRTVRSEAFSPSPTTAGARIS
ncbi:hypothetical protein [Streptomyces sp. NBC_00687]|uniref:hypothetical protein n=1 Tax=Streptomyces sp. NBC_00687 TaxID=2975807 RepID=UPI002257E8CF|nr:hypothetical protein [Streptomyces sp. NBC_00687]MCX4920238.1 hypothetical protein [Streptomyces sp. NBC_00687]